MTRVVLINGAPRPGHEIQYALAWKHRAAASAMMLRFTRNPFAWHAYKRAFRIWSRALSRISEHGQDVALTP